MRVSRITRHLANVAAFAALITAAPACARAQDPSPSPRNRTSTPTTTSSMRTGDREVVTLLVKANQQEIAQSRQALPELQNTEVRAFAQKMINEHTENFNTVNSIALRLGIPVPTTNDSMTRSTRPMNGEPPVDSSRITGNDTMRTPPTTPPSSPTPGTTPPSNPAPGTTPTPSGYPRPTPTPSPSPTGTPPSTTTPSPTTSPSPTGTPSTTNPSPTGTPQSTTTPPTTTGAGSTTPSTTTGTSSSGMSGMSGMGGMNDRQYLDAQITAHQQLLGQLPANENTAINDRELRSHVSETRREVTAHLDEARRLRDALPRNNP